MQELNHKLAEIKQEILDGMEQLESSKEVYEFQKNLTWILKREKSDSL